MLSVLSLFKKFAVSSYSVQIVCERNSVLSSVKKVLTHFEMYLTLFFDKGVDGGHVRIRQRLQVEVSVGKLGRSALLSNFVHILKLHQLTLGRNSQT